MARSRKVNGIPIKEETRFSVFVEETDVAGIADLKAWLAWFQGQNIPSTIALTDRGFALYRSGMTDED